VADFPLSLFQEGKSSSIILGYRTAVCQTISQLTGQDIFVQPVIRSLAASFARDRLSMPVDFPRWDLLVVLDFLSGPQFNVVSCSLIN